MTNYSLRNVYLILQSLHQYFAYCCSYGIASSFFVVALVVTLSNALKAADLPQDILEAITANVEAIDNVSITWERQYSSLVPSNSLPEHMEKDPSFFEVDKAKFHLANGKLRHEYDRPVLGTDRGGRKIIKRKQGIVTFDGENMFRGNKPGTLRLVTISSLEHLKKFGPDHFAFRTEYFDAAGFSLPNKLGTIHLPIQSIVLKLLDDGAMVSDVKTMNKEVESYVVLSLTKDDQEWVFHLDPKKQYAVQTLVHLDKSGQPMRKVENQDFEKVSNPTLWLPRTSKIQFYSWPMDSKQQQFEKAFLTSILNVSSITREHLSDDNFVIDYRHQPGLAVADSRLKGALDAEGGFVTFRVPADPRDLEKAAQAAAEGEAFLPGRRLGIWVYINLMLVVILVCLVLFRRMQSM